MKGMWKVAVAGFVAIAVSATANAQGAGGAGAGGQGTGGTGTGTTGAAGQGGIGQTPWFSNQGVREQLKISPEQYQKLEKSYADYYGRLRTGYTGLDKLSDKERSQKMNELTSTFNTDMMKSSADILTPEQRTRFNQLYTQYRGYDALNDPDIQRKLKMTDEQREQLRKYSTQYNEQMTAVYKDAGSNREAAMKRYDALRRQSGERINTLLNDEQRRAWRDITGEPYTFPPPFGATNNNTKGQNR